MPEFKVYLDAIAKFGVVPILVIWNYKLDKEQSYIKEKMFDCFQDKEDILKNRMSSHDKKTLYIKPYMVAVLPCKEKKENEYYREN